MSPRVYLGLGSNLGDRLDNLRSGVSVLQRVEGLRLARSSRVYETEPVGPPQPRYLNAVVEGLTSLGPRSLLQACLGVERALGRVRGERWGPRVLDVDVLTFGRQHLEERDLVVPHPRMHERGFVLIPLLELDPDPPLPGGRRLGELRPAAGVGTDVRVVAPALPLERRTG